MIDFIIEKAPEGSDDMRIFRYPYMSCQVFCCEIPELLQIFQEDSENKLLNRLFSILDSTSPLDPYLAGYFEKTLGVLFRRLTITLMSYINRDGITLLLNFIKHIDNYSIMQVIQRLMLPHIPFSVQGQDGGDGEDDKDDKDTDLSPEDLILTHCHWSYFEKTPSLLLEQMLCGRVKNEIENNENMCGQVGHTEGTTDESNGDSGSGPGPDGFDIPAHIADLLITVLQLSPAESPLLINICDVKCLESLLGAAMTNSININTNLNTNHITQSHTDPSTSSPLWVLTDDTQCVSASALTVFESIISRLSEALVLLNNINHNDSMNGNVDDNGNDIDNSMNSDTMDMEENQHLLQQAAEVSLLINLNIEHVCTSIKPFVSQLAGELKLYVDRPIGMLLLQSKMHQKCLGHRGLQLVKLVETIFRLVLCDVVTNEANINTDNITITDTSVVEDITNITTTDIASTTSATDNGDIVSEVSPSPESVSESNTVANANTAKTPSPPLDGFTPTPNTPNTTTTTNTLNVKKVMLEMIPLLLDTGILRYCWEMCFIYNNVSLLHLSVHRILLMVLDANNTEIKL